HQCQLHSCVAETNARRLEDRLGYCWGLCSAVPGWAGTGMDHEKGEVGGAAMKGLAYGALAGIVAGIVCFGTGFLAVTVITVPAGSSFGVGVEPWNLPGTLLGLAVWFHMLALTRKRGIPTAIVSMLAYNGVRLIGWGFCLEMIWCLVHARWREALACFAG